MSSPEEPIFVPGGDGHGGRYESADMYTEALEAYLKDTIFEDDKEIEALLLEKFGMFRRDSLDWIRVSMTREMSGEGILNGDLGIPVSGKEPELMGDTRIKTLSEHDLSIQIYKVFNRNDEYRYEYVLEPVSN